ncbi:MAG: septal ring lytic transglycosylase RlpA family protein [Bacteroidota bacterium]|nr:septal ring lytic transglycosylase RlpA family protein [Bacteroidota bacterium]
MKQIISVVLIMAFSICAKAQKDTSTLYKPKTVIGIASFYSTNLDGTKTSTGETYRNSKFSGASNHFALNTWVRVTNLRNNKSIKVRINDHMHVRMAKRGRVIDLSRSAAKELGFISRGLTRVKVEEIPNSQND